MRARFLFSSLAAFVLLLGNVAGARAAETVWSGLVIANNVAQPAAIPDELRHFEGTLKSLFGYNQFHVIGQSRNTLKTGEEDWLATSKYFSLHVDSKAAAKSGYLLNLQLFQEEKLLLETDVKLTKSSPLIVRGPQVGDGQLILVLVLE